MELRSLSMSFEANDEGLKVSGVVNKPEELSNLLSTARGTKFRETVKKGVFAKAIKKAKDINFLFDHDKNKLLASTNNGSLSLKETDNGVEMEANIVETSYGKDAYALIKSGLIGNMSFGFKCLKDSWQRMEDGTPLRVIEDLELFEVSCLQKPAYSQSAISARGIEIDEQLQIPDIIDYSIEHRGENGEVEFSMEVRSNENREYHLYIDGEVGWLLEDKYWMIGPVIPQDLVEMKDFLATKDVIYVHINTPGGSVWGGFGIYNLIKSLPGKTIAVIDGLAGSIGSVIGFACDEIIMNEASMFMVHLPLTGIRGNKTDFKRALQMLEITQENILKVYMSKAKEGVTPEEVNALMEAETYLNKEQMDKYFNLTITNEKPIITPSNTNEGDEADDNVVNTNSDEVPLTNKVEEVVEGNEDNNTTNQTTKDNEAFNSLMKEYLKLKKERLHNEH